MINYDPTAIPEPPDGPIAVILIIGFAIACAFAFVIWID